MSKKDARDEDEKMMKRVIEKGDEVEHDIEQWKKTTYVDSFRDDYWRTSREFLTQKSNDMTAELDFLITRRKKEIKKQDGLRGLYEAITNDKDGRQWIDDFFSIGNAATQTRIVCDMPDGFSQIGQAIKLGPANFKQDWKGYGTIRGKGNVKLDLEAFTYRKFIECRKRQCWLCGMPLYWDFTMKPEGEHILQYPMMTCFGAGPVTKLFLVESRHDDSKGLEENSILSGFHSDVSSLIDESRQNEFVDWKRRVRTFSYAWSHSHCNRVKKDKSFIKIGMGENGDIFYYINYKAVNWFAGTISDSILSKKPLYEGRIGRGWRQVLDGLDKSKKYQPKGTKKIPEVQRKANAIGFDSIYENIMKQLIPLNLLLNEGFGSLRSPRGINLNITQNKIRANIYFNYRRLRVYFKQHMEQFRPAGSNLQKKALKNKHLLMDFFTTILKKDGDAIGSQKALLNHCFNYEKDIGGGSSRGGGLIEDAIEIHTSGRVNPYDFTSTYTYLPLAELLNEMTNYKNTDHDEEGVQYIMDVADETKGFDDSMNFNHLLEQIEPSDYDKGGGSIVEYIHGAYQTHEGEFKEHSKLAMNNFIRNMLMKMKFDKYGELLNYILEKLGHFNPNFKRGIRNNYPEAEQLEESVSSIRKQQKQQGIIDELLFNGKINKKDFDEWFALHNTVKVAPYIYDIDGEVKKLVERNLITLDEANEEYYDYFKSDIVKINDGAEWETWQINLTNYIQHRTPTGEIKTFDSGDLEGEEYMVKEYDFAQTYRNNLKIIQYAGLLPRMDNTSPRQKKFIAEKVKERNQERQAKMLENMKNKLPPLTGINLKQGDGIPKNFSVPEHTKSGEIHGNRGPQNVRALHKLNEATYGAMTAKEQEAVDTLPKLKRAQSLTSSPLHGSPQTNLQGTPEQVRRRLEGKNTISGKRSRSLDSYIYDKEEKKKKKKTAQRRIAEKANTVGALDKMDTAGGKKKKRKKRTKKRRRKKKKTRKSKRKKKRTKKKRRRRKKRTRRRR